MESIVIALIAGIIGYFIYQASIPLKNKIEQSQKDNLGKDKTTFGTSKSEKQIAFEKIQIDLRNFVPKDIKFSQSKISGGNYWDCVQVMQEFKSIDSNLKSSFIEQAEEYCSNQEWAGKSKIMVGYENNNGIIVIKYK
jgi:hypothetical protein